MPLVRVDLDKADVRGHRIECMHHLPAFLGRKQPVRCEGDQAEARLGSRKGVRQDAPMVGGDVEIVHGPRDV